MYEILEINFYYHSNVLFHIMRMYPRNAYNSNGSHEHSAIHITPIHNLLLCEQYKENFMENSIGSLVLA